MIGAPPAAAEFLSTVKLPGFFKKHVVIWRNGGRQERFFLLVGVFTYLFLPSATIVMFLLFWNGAFPYEALFSFALAATTYGAFHETFSLAVINAKVFRQYVEEGRFRPHDDYFREWIRFLEQDGDHGLYPGAVRWAFGFWAVYYGIMLFAVVFTLTLTPTLGLATPFISAGLDVVFILPCWLAWQFHRRAVSREMDSKGYRLSEYAKAAGWAPASR